MPQDIPGEQYTLATTLIHALDDAPLRRPVMADDDPPDTGMAGYRALAAAVLRQLAHDMQVAHRKGPERTLRYLAKLSADETGPFATWCETLGLDIEDIVDTIIAHITAKRMPHGEAAAD